MLKQRVLTACVLLAVLGITLSVSQTWAFTALLLIFAGAAVWEWLRLVLPAAQAKGWTPILLAVVFSVGLGLLDTFVPQLQSGLSVIFAVAALVWLGLAAWLVVKHAFPAVPAYRFLYVLAALLLTGACWFALVLAYRQGVVFMLSIMAIVWIADIAAYFSGKAFGRRKLAPSISPGKTWEGVAGGVLGVCVAAVVAAWIPALNDSFSSRLFLASPRLALLILALLVGLSIVGDLFESHLKRQAGVKDSSQLLPGHGGVLDRVDALLPVLPVALLISQFW